MNSSRSPLLLRLAIFACCTWAAPHIGVAQESEPDQKNKQESFSVRLEVMQKISIAARRDGFLASSILLPGSVIGKGQVLAEIDVAKKLLEAKRLRAELAALEEEASNDADLVKAQQTLEVSRLRSQELGVARLRTRVPQLEIVEANTKFKSDQAELSGAKSRFSQSKFNLAAKKAELEIIELEIEQSTIRAPFDGIVFKQFKNAGEAVSQTEPIAEVYRLDYLLGSVLLKQEQIAPQNFSDVSGTVQVELPKLGVQSFQFEVSGPLPRVERDGRFLAVIKVKNRKTKNGNTWTLLPGMQGTLQTTETPPPQYASE